MTSYRSVPAQTDSSPLYTSTGERTSISGVAVSWDLLCGACRKAHRRCREPEMTEWKLHYGDCLYVDQIGFRIVNDIMGKHKRYKISTKDGIKRVFKRQNQWIDVWVQEYKDERAFHKVYGITKHKVWKIKKK